MGVLARITIGGQVSPGSLSGAPVGKGVLLTFSTVDQRGRERQPIARSSLPSSMPQGNVADFATVDDLGSQQTTTFTGRLNGLNGAFRAGADPGRCRGGGRVHRATVATSFGRRHRPGAQEHPTHPSRSERRELWSGIGLCAVADLNGDAGFCHLREVAILTPTSTSVHVGLRSWGSSPPSRPSPVLTPTISNTQFLNPHLPDLPPVYEGITTLPNRCGGSLGGEPPDSSVGYWVPVRPVRRRTPGDAKYGARRN